MLTLYYPTDAGTTEAITLDASVTETHGGTVGIPTHPVEKGANVSDHVRKEPASLRVEGLLVDHPMAAQKTAQATTIVGADDGEGRAAYIYAHLENLRDVGTLFEVHTGIKVYSNMLIQDLSAPRDKSIAGAVRFSATLREVRLVESQVVPIKTSTTKAKPKTDGGKQTGKTATEQEKKKTILWSTLEKVSDALGKSPP